MAFNSLKDLGWGGAHLNTSLPKVLAELQGLRISGPYAGVAKSQLLEVPEIEPDDTLAKVLAVSAADPIITDCTDAASILSRNASASITLEPDPTKPLQDGDSVTIWGKTYTFKEMHVGIATTVAPYVVPFQTDPVTGDADLLVAAGNLAKVIMSCDSRLLAYAHEETVTVISRIPGAGTQQRGDGNYIQIASPDDSIAVSNATFLGGSDAHGLVFDDDSTENKLVLVVWYKKPR